MLENVIQDSNDTPSDDDLIYVDHSVLKNFMKDVFIKLGVPKDDAEIIAEVLITSDLRRHKESDLLIPQ